MTRKSEMALNVRRKGESFRSTESLISFSDNFRILLVRLELEIVRRLVVPIESRFNRIEYLKKNFKLKESFVRKCESICAAKETTKDKRRDNRLNRSSERLKQSLFLLLFALSV